MSNYIMDLNDYKRYFKLMTEIDDDEEYIMLNVEGYRDIRDGICEYSIKWFNIHNEEKGIIHNINTSSEFALKSCYWCDDELTDEE